MFGVSLLVSVLVFVSFSVSVALLISLLLPLPFSVPVSVFVTFLALLVVSVPISALLLLSLVISLPLVGGGLRRRGVGDLWRLNQVRGLGGGCLYRCCGGLGDGGSGLLLFPL